MNEPELLSRYKLETLSGANLSGCYLSGCYLYGVDLSGANLSGANLSGTDLRKAKLLGANLNDCDLSGTDLSWANLRNADLTDCDLYGADISRANLSGANLLGVQGLASMKEEMEMLILLREAIRQELFEFDMSHWHGDEIPDTSSFESFLNTCGTTHCASGFCQVKLAKEGNPIALTLTSIVGSYAIPSMAWLFSSSKEQFVVYLDKLISGECPLLQR